MSKRDLDTALRALAERQHGLAGRNQSRELGASRRLLEQRLQSPDWQAVTSQVARLVGSAETFEQRCMAAVLDAGHRSAVSHRSAAALWCLPGFPHDVIEVTRKRARSCRPTHLADLHEVRSLHWVGRVDNLYPDERLVVEVDSSLHHSTVLDRGADARRDAELRAAGFAVCRVREGDVWHHPKVVVAQVRAALSRTGSSNGTKNVPFELPERWGVEVEVGF